MKPFKLKPVLQDYLWGGTRLKDEYGKQSPMPVVAESWELSANSAGSSVIATGEFTGIGFDEFCGRFPELCGINAAGRFPVLVKLIDAANALSVQVHPGDEYALPHENEPGKTEMWIILHSEPGAFVYFGFNREISREEIRERIETDTLVETLRILPVRRGDVIFIPAGTIHAIGAGNVLAEIQQNSNVTYRVYDYSRTGADGKKRPLHIDKALDVIHPGPASPAAPGACAMDGGSDYQLERLARCEYFTVDMLTLSGRFMRSTGSFLSVLCVEGDCLLECEGDALHITKGDSVFVPARATVTFSGIGGFVLTMA